MRIPPPFLTLSGGLVVLAALSAHAPLGCGGAPISDTFPPPGIFLVPLEDEPDSGSEPEEEEDDEDAGARGEVAPAAIRANGCTNSAAPRPARRASGCHTSRDCLRGTRRARCVNGASIGHPGQNVCVADGCVRDQDCRAGTICVCSDTRGNRCEAP